MAAVNADEKTISLPSVVRGHHEHKTIYGYYSNTSFAQGRCLYQLHVSAHTLNPITDNYYTVNKCPCTEHCEKDY